jgi:hypothetical protein
LSWKSSALRRISSTVEVEGGATPNRTSLECLCFRFLGETGSERINGDFAFFFVLTGGFMFCSGIGAVVDIVATFASSAPAFSCDEGESLMLRISKPNSLASSGSSACLWYITESVELVLLVPLEAV